MPFQFFNPNPKNQRVGDCAVRAICKAIGTDWQDAYISLCAEGLACKDMPSSNYVWGNYLKRFGFEERGIGSICPVCTTVAQFAEEHPENRYVLATQGHVVAVVNGSYWDSWDSGNEIILYYYEKEM
jgi:hypothetical protein